MCLIHERQSTICGHEASYTELCVEKKTQSVLKIFCPKCVPTRRIISYYEICHDCRRFWQLYGVDEISAIQRTQVYRRKYDYLGPLSPYSTGLVQPKLVQDIYINFDSRNNPRAKLLADRVDQGVGRNMHKAGWPVGDRENIKTHEIPAHQKEDLTDWLTKQAIEDASSSKRESSGTVLTLWPVVPESQISRNHNKVQDEGKLKAKVNVVPGGINNLPSPDEFEMDEVETNLQTERPLEGSSYFELDALVNHPQGEVDAYAFERQDLHMPIPRTPAHILGSSYQGLGGLEPVTGSAVKPSPDLNKPLPPLPKRDSPMPGCPFESENPEGDVGYSEYIPRFI